MLAPPDSSSLRNPAATSRTLPEGEVLREEDRSRFLTHEPLSPSLPLSTWLPRCKPAPVPEPRSPKRGGQNIPPDTKRRRPAWVESHWARQSARRSLSVQSRELPGTAGRHLQARVHKKTSQPTSKPPTLLAPPS